MACGRYHKATKSKFTERMGKWWGNIKNVFHSGANKAGEIARKTSDFVNNGQLDNTLNTINKGVDMFQNGVNTAKTIYQNMGGNTNNKFFNTVDRVNTGINNARETVNKGATWVKNNGGYLDLIADATGH